MTSRILSTVFLLLLTGQASAATFFGEDVADFGQNNTDRLESFPNATQQFEAFLSVLTADVGTEDFETFAIGTSNPALEFPGAGYATLTGAGSVLTPPSGQATFNGTYATSGSQYFFVETREAFNISFSGPTAAFGFFAVDVGDFGAQLLLEFTHVSGAISSIPVDHSIGTDGSTSGSVFFFGQIDESDPFTQVQFSSGGGFEGFAFDDMTIASVEQVVIPTPASGILFGTGLAGLLGIRVRRLGARCGTPRPPVGTRRP
jgi:hypothetical protein